MTRPKRIPKWLPDWRDESLYPDPKLTRPTQWAWEFLRRNPEYQKDYRKSRRIPDDYTPENSGRIIALRNKHLIMRFVNPATDWSADLNKKLSFQSFGSPPYRSYMGKYHPGGLEPTKPGQIVIGFNLNRSIKIQLERARIILERTRALQAEQGSLKSKQKRRPRPELLRLYLRVLDADRANVPLAKMAEALLPGVKNVYPEYGATKRIFTNLESAKKLSDEDYRFLVFLEDPERLREHL